MTDPTLIDGRYRVRQKLGSGLSGEVFAVAGPEGEAALKLLRSEVEGLADEERIATFKFEFSLLKGLQHPNIVRIFDFGFDPELRRFYFTEELIQGRSLDRAARGLAVQALREYFVQALQGLAYLHAHKVLHGDLKPENLLVHEIRGEEPLLKLIDFGISHPSLAVVGGTPPYMAPEKILKEATDARSDLYSLAVVFYSLLTGENPFLKKNPLATLQAHLHFQPPPATLRNREVDPVWSSLLDRMLAKNPRQRIASAEDCLRYLETQGESPLAARPRDVPEFFIGREEILREATGFLDEIKKSRSPRALLVVGEKGLGNSSLLTELKYEAELREIEVVGPDETPKRGAALRFLAPAAFREALQQRRLPKLLEQTSLAAALAPEEEAEALRACASAQPLALRLRPLNLAETEAYLREVTRNPEIPSPLTAGLFQWSRGYPGPLQTALRSLLKDPFIVDSSGKWNLAPFREAGPELARLEVTEDALAHALEGELGADPREHWRLELRRAEALARQARLDAALELLTDLEERLPRVFERPQRLFERARLLEARGWVYVKQNRFQEAREDFASGLSLLRECEVPAAALELRLKNFVAFLDLREGRFAEAIAAFEATAAQAEGLPPAERQRVTNNELANAYLAAGRVPEGIARLKLDFEFFATHANPSFRMKVAYHLGEAYLRVKDYPAAADSYLQVAELAREERHWEYLIRAYNGLGNVRSLQKRLNESLDYYQRSLALAEYQRDFMSAATVAQNRGVLLSELGRLEEAIHDLELSKRLVGKIHPSSHTRNLMARATLELGEVYRKQGDFAKARASYTEALNRAEEDPNLKPFRFYPNAALATLALAEDDFAAFRELAPKLIYLAETEEEKKTLAELLAKAPAEAREGMAAAPPTAAPPAPMGGAPDAWANILKINRALLTEHDPRFLFQKILQYAAELCGAETALLLLENEAGDLVVEEAFNAELNPEQLEVSQQVSRQVLQTGSAIVTADAQVDSGFNQFQSVIALHLRSIACVPIRAQQKVVGLLYLAHRYKAGLFHREALGLLEAFGDQAGLALQNLRYLQQLQALNAQLQNRLEAAEEEIDRLKTDLRGRVKNPYPMILGKSRAIVDILHLLDRISDTNLSVLILGETGSGKELIARSVHEHSRRRKGPFIAVNCGAIPENLMESELFGYKAGAFTGATRDKRGLLEEANGGTIFLDEIAELPLNTQAKLLRALQEREIVRLGDTKVVALDIRIVAATHRHLEAWVSEGKFREDLFYRVAQMVLNLPALRERKEDLFLLAEHFLERAAGELNLSKTPRLSKELLSAMAAYHWPGNVRELENFIRAATAFAERGLIRLEDIPEFLRRRLQGAAPAPLESLPASPARPLPTQAAATRTAPGELYRPGWPWTRYEEALYASALARHGMNCERAAEELGVGVATVYLKMRKYALKANAAAKAQETGLPSGIGAAELKERVIRESYRRHGESPYAVAKELGINVGTVYRNLK
ncbi:MAG: sigma 54-interacting transcriptional regulator [bacterium]